MKYRSTWELSSIPDDALKAEWARRTSLRRAVYAGGRPKKLLICPRCKRAGLGARELAARCPEHAPHS